jgi:hypothetical protein
VVLREPQGIATEWNRVPLNANRWSEFKAGHPPVQIVVRYLPGRPEVMPAVEDGMAGLRKSIWGTMLCGWFFGSFAILMLLARATFSERSGNVFETNSHKGSKPQ